MKLPGFTPGESAQNAVVGAMYIVVILAVVGVAVVSAGVPGMLSSDSSNDAGQSASSPNSGQATQAQAQSQGNDQSQSQGSGWVTVTSAASSSGGGSGVAGTSTQVVDRQQLYISAIEAAASNSSRVQLESAEIRNNQLYVRYSQSDLSRSEVINGMGTMTGGYLSVVGTGGNIESLHGTVTDESGESAYTYTIQRDLVTQLNNNQLSNSELTQRFNQSLQPANQSSSTTALA